MASPAPAGSVTNYLAIDGADSMMSKTGVSLRAVTDGNSFTMLLVEVDTNRAVPWTKPADHQIKAANPKAGLGGLRIGLCSPVARQLALGLPFSSVP